MDYSLQLITGPTVEPVSLEDAKCHINVEHDEDDSLISALIVAARRHVEARINGAIVRQKWRYTTDYFCDEIYLAKPPVREIVSVSYIDTDGATQTVDSATYELDRGQSKLLKAYGASWPAARWQKNAIWVDFYTGYYDYSTSPINIISEIPDDLRVAIMMMVGDMYEHRERQSEVQLYGNSVYDLLLGPYWSPV